MGEVVQGFRPRLYQSCIQHAPPSSLLLIVRSTEYTEYSPGHCEGRGLRFEDLNALLQSGATKNRVTCVGVSQRLFLSTNKLPTERGVHVPTLRGAGKQETS